MAAKQTFVFHAPLANESPAKQERSAVARIRELISRKEIKVEKEKQAGRGRYGRCYIYRMVI